METPRRKQHAIVGYPFAYQAGAANFCPRCGGSQWYIGRITAECAYCGTALPLDPAETEAGGDKIRWRKSRGTGRSGQGDRITAVEDPRRTTGTRA
jgi:hypothetical protein